MLDQRFDLRRLHIPFQSVHVKPNFLGQLEKPCPGRDFLCDSSWLLWKGM
jgi:hypothetical protein